MIKLKKEMYYYGNVTMSKKPTGKYCKQ